MESNNTENYPFKLINSQLGDIDIKSRSLKARGKGAKVRKEFFGKRTFRTLKE